MFPQTQPINPATASTPKSAPVPSDFCALVADEATPEPGLLIINVGFCSTFTTVPEFSALTLASLLALDACVVPAVEGVATACVPLAATPACCWVCWWSALATAWSAAAAPAASRCC